MKGGTRTTRGQIRPPRPVSSACERAGSSSPAPPGWSSGVLVAGPAPTGARSAGLGSRSRGVVGVGGGLGVAVPRPLALPSSLPHPAPSGPRSSTTPGSVQGPRSAEVLPEEVDRPLPGLLRVLLAVGAEAVGVVEERVPGALVELELRRPRRRRPAPARAPWRRRPRRSRRRCRSGRARGASIFEKSGLPCGIT